MPKQQPLSYDRRHFIGGSDARIIMGKDEKALLRLWKEKLGEAAHPDLSGELIVQLGLVTEDLNRRWYERNVGHRVVGVQSRLFHRSIPWMAATLDGLVKETGAVFEAKFMLPWSFSEEAAAAKHMAQLQHNMLVADTRRSVLSIINGGGKWVEISIEADPIYQTVLIAVEKAFWHAVKTGEPPALYDGDPPKARIEAIRTVDMNASNAWAEFAALYRQTRNAHLDHEGAKSELKALMPLDAKEAMGHGIRAKRSKSGAVTFESKRGEEIVIAPNAVAPKRRTRRAKNDVQASMLDLKPEDRTSTGPTLEASEPSKIDKSVLTFCEPRRKRDKQHLRFVASQPCLICARAPSDAHHLRFAQPRAMGRKSSDEFTVPLCRTHHRQNHQTGREEIWWASVSIDPLDVAAKLWRTSHGRDDPSVRL